MEGEDAGPIRPELLATQIALARLTIENWLMLLVLLQERQDGFAAPPITQTKD